VCDHIKAAAQFLPVAIMPLVGGMAQVKQERQLR
jgi:hypothetical protein